MPRSKHWLRATDAATYLSTRLARSVSPQYINILARQKRVAKKHIDGRTCVYSRSDLDRVTLRSYHKKDDVK